MNVFLAFLVLGFFAALAYAIWHDEADVEARLHAAEKDY